MNPIETISTVLALLTIVGQGIVAILLGVWGIRSFPYRTKFLHLVSRYSLLAAFVVSLTAMLGSLFYSDIAHYEPCKLCWYQRIFMYPQVILLGIAASKREQHIRKYILSLSSIGLVIAIYHYLLQIGVTPEILPCSATGYSVSCAENFVMQFGYITIPMMSLTAFLMIIVILGIGKKRESEEKVPEKKRLQRR